MTDLERAEWLVAQVQQLTSEGCYLSDIAATEIEPALAAARREGAEEERAKQGEAGALIRRAAELVRTQESGAYSEARCAAQREGAAEMRERAAAATTFCCFECSRVIRALPLTPEVPA